MTDNQPGLNMLEEILGRSGDELPHEILDLDEFLKGSPLFSTLAADERRGLARKAKYRWVSSGEVLMREGSRGDTFAILKSGRVIVEATFEGLTKRLATLGPGAIVGEVAVLMGTPRTATVTADGDTELFEFRGDDVVPVLSSHPELKRKLQTLIEERTDQAIAVFLGRPSDE